MAVLQVYTCDVGVDVSLGLSILILVIVADFDVLEFMSEGFQSG